MADTHVEFKFVLFSLACFSSDSENANVSFFCVCAPKGGSWSLAFLAETVENE